MGKLRPRIMRARWQVSTPSRGKDSELELGWMFSEQNLSLRDDGQSGQKA